VGAASWGTLLLAALGALACVAPLLLVILAVAAFAPPRSSGLRCGNHRIAVLVPAHNEVELLPRCLASLRAQEYPAQLIRIVVVADNCTDATVEVARAAGAEVMVRDEPDLRGKGRALRWAIDRLVDETQPVDAIAVVDADSQAEPGLLGGLEAALTAGADAVQGEYLVLDDGSGPAIALRQAAFLLFHRTRFRGRAALGLPCSLVGNGMLLGRSLLEHVPWNAFTGAEDLEYSTDLRLAGIGPSFAPRAVVRGPAPGLGRAAGTQRMRWEGGRLHVVRTRLPRLLAETLTTGRFLTLDAAVELAMPPLGLLALMSLAGGGISLAGVVTGVVPLWTLLIWAAGMAMLAAYVVVGLLAARAPRSAFLALLSTPRFLVAKLGTYLRMTRGLRADRWQRTERPGEASHRRSAAAPRHRDPLHRAIACSASRVDVCGVPLDRVDGCQAGERIMAAVGSRPALQVCTVNLQFLVTAHCHREVHRVLREAGLNVADGAPVVWLSRLRGLPLEGRVCGTDLVPALASLAERRGARIFLLGGRDGAAAQAAAELTRCHPRLEIAGTFEPPVTGPESSLDDEIIRRIRDARADILLVALGHPKQDLWIAANRNRLPVSVAMGVGCTFDILAGRFQRAPEWARRSGLEWLYRLAQEPKRLALRYAVCAAWLVVVLMPMAVGLRLVGVRTPVPALGAPMASGGEDGAIEAEHRTVLG
jgi:exopolysaccharide biosynthesis WecB/TagA/CpsF family protein